MSPQALILCVSDCTIVRKEFLHYYIEHSYSQTDRK